MLRPRDRPQRPRHVRLRPARQRTTLLRPSLPPGRLPPTSRQRRREHTPPATRRTGTTTQPLTLSKWGQIRPSPWGQFGLTQPTRIDQRPANGTHRKSLSWPCGRILVSRPVRTPSSSTPTAPAAPRSAKPSTTCRAFPSSSLWTTARTLRPQPTVRRPVPGHGRHYRRHLRQPSRSLPVRPSGSSRRPTCFDTDDPVSIARHGDTRQAACRGGFRPRKCPGQTSNSHATARPSST